MALRLTQNDKDKIKKVNQSITRKNKQLDKLGVDIYKPIIKANDFKTRKQLNEYLQEARVYTRGYGYKYKKNNYDVVASNIELARAKRLAKDITRERQKRFKEIASKEFKSYGKSTGSSIYQRRLMTKEGEDKYGMFRKVNLNFGSIRDREQFEKRIENFTKQLEPDYIPKKNQQLKDNIIKAIHDHWGKYGDKSIEYIKSLTPAEVTEQFFTEEIFDFKYIYRDEDKARQAEIFEATYNLT